MKNQVSSPSENEVIQKLTDILRYARKLRQLHGELRWHTAKWSDTGPVQFVVFVGFTNTMRVVEKSWWLSVNELYVGGPAEELIWRINRSLYLQNQHAANKKKLIRGCAISNEERNAIW